MIWISHYLLNRIRLNLDLDNSCWIRKIPSFAKNNIKMKEGRKEGKKEVGFNIFYIYKCIIKYKAGYQQGARLKLDKTG